MKKILVLIALSFMTVSTLTAQMKDPQNWVGYEEIMGVKNGLRFYDFDVNLIESSAPANVFWPGDDIRLKFQLINNTSINRYRCESTRLSLWNERNPQ